MQRRPGHCQAEAPKSASDACGGPWRPAPSSLPSHQDEGGKQAGGCDQGRLVKRQQLRTSKTSFEFLLLWSPAQQLRQEPELPAKRGRVKATCLRKSEAPSLCPWRRPRAALCGVEPALWHLLVLLVSFLCHKFFIFFCVLGNSDTAGVCPMCLLEPPRGLAPRKGQPGC